MEPDAGSGPIPGLLATYPSGALLLRDSLAAAGHFLLPWIGAACVKQGHRVLVLAAAFSPAKHAAALRKIGVNATTTGGSTSSSSPVCFVSAAGCCSSSSTTTGSSEQASQAPQLQRLYQQVAAAATQLLAPAAAPQQHQQLTVVVDSLTCLSALCGGAGDQVSALVHHLMALGEALQVPAYRLVLLAAHDVPGGQHQLLSHVAARSHVVADVAPLEGRTAALDGSVTITIRRAPPPACQLAPGVSSLRPAADTGGRATPGWLQAGARSVWFYRSGDVAVTWLSEVHGKELMD